VGPQLVVAAVALLPASALMMFAAMKMRRLENYWLAVSGSVLAMLITPGNLVGLPIGVWSLVVLSDSQVRAAFRLETQGAAADGQLASSREPK
jgi:hypothetical protein